MMSLFKIIYSWCIKWIWSITLNKCNLLKFNIIFVKEVYTIKLFISIRFTNFQRSYQIRCILIRIYINPLLCWWIGFSQCRICKGYPLSWLIWLSLLLVLLLSSLKRYGLIFYLLLRGLGNQCLNCIVLTYLLLGKLICPLLNIIDLIQSTIH